MAGGGGGRAEGGRGKAEGGRGKAEGGRRKEEDRAQQAAPISHSSFVISPSFPRHSSFLFWLLIEKAPLFCLSVISTIVGYWAQGGTMVSAEILPLRLRVLNALVSYASYLGMFLLPRNLSVFYPYHVANLYLWKAGAALVLLLGITIFAWTLRNRCPAFGVGWLWYLGMLLPMIGLTQAGAQAMADRYTYLPQIGLGIALAWLPVWCNRKAAVAAAVIWLSLLTTIAWRQTSTWHDSESLWIQAIASTSQPSPLLENNLAGTLIGLGRYDEAAGWCEKSLRIDPKNPFAYANLGDISAARGQLDQAIGQYRHALEIVPYYFGGHKTLAGLLIRQGRFDEAAAEYRKALDLSPDQAEQLSEIAQALSHAGQRADAHRAEK